MSASGYAFPNLAAAATSVELVIEGVARLAYRRWAGQYGKHLHNVLGVPRALRSANAREAWQARRERAARLAE